MHAIKQPASSIFRFTHIRCSSRGTRLIASRLSFRLESRDTSKTTRQVFEDLPTMKDGMGTNGLVHIAWTYRPKIAGPSITPDMTQMLTRLDNRVIVIWNWAANIGTFGYSIR